MNLVWFVLFFNSISTPYGLFNTENRFICNFFSVITIFSTFYCIIFFKNHIFTIQIFTQLFGFKYSYLILIIYTYIFPFNNNNNSLRDYMVSSMPIHRWKPNRYYYSESEWTWEWWQWKSTPHSPELDPYH